MWIRVRLCHLVLAVLLFIAAPLRSDAVTVGVDPAANWLGYMNVANLPSQGGAHQFGSGWGTADLRATFSGPLLTLAPNTINDPAPYWYTPSGGADSTGNKIMDANFYVETTGVYTGDILTFTGMVLSNTMVGKTDPNGNGWSAIAFIKDFVPDYSSAVTTTMPLTPGVFTVTLPLINDPARHVQYGFEVVGPDVWPEDPDLPSYGNVLVTAVPEPASLALAAGGAAGLLLRRRKFRR